MDKLVTQNFCGDPFISFGGNRYRDLIPSVRGGTGIRGGRKDEL
jgi:hypothetical protein